MAALGKYAYNLADILRSALANVGRDVDALTESGWSSTASASFAEGWRECQDGGSKIIEALVTMASKLGVTASSYSAQDNQFSARVSSLNLP